MNSFVEKNDVVKKLAIIYIYCSCVAKIIELTNTIQDQPYNMTMFVIGCAFMLYILIKNKGKIYYNKVLILFILCIIINFLFHLDIGTIKTNIFEIFYIIVIYNIAKHFLEEEEYIILVKIILIVCGIIASIFLAHFTNLLVNSGIQSKNDISRMIYTNVNSGALLALICLIMLYYLYRVSEINKWITALASILFVTGIIISQSRTALLLLVCLVVYKLLELLFNNDKYKLFKNFLKICFIVITCISTLLLIFIIIKKDYNMENATDKTIYEIEKKLASATSTRYWLWKYSINGLLERNPLFGLEDNFGNSIINNNKEIIDYLSRTQKELFYRNNVHSGYIQILVRNGILGFSIMITFLITFLSKVFKLDNEQAYNNYIKYLYLAFIIMNLFENNIILSNSFFVLLLWIHIGVDSNLIEAKKMKKRDR